MNMGFENAKRDLTTDLMYKLVKTNVGWRRVMKEDYRQFKAIRYKLVDWTDEGTYALR
jgi:hypothetical protein